MWLNLEQQTENSLLIDDSAVTLVAQISEVSEIKAQKSDRKAHNIFQNV